MTGRSFLFLQGLATPFFVRLGDALAADGHAVHRANFCAGDRLFWRRPNATDVAGRAEEWPATLAALAARHGVTDMVMFGDCRPRHEAAIAFARGAGITPWVFEEAYLRPGYLTLEPWGVNGFSRLPREPARIRAMAAGLPPAAPEALSAGSFFRRASDDVLYSAANLLLARRFPHWRTHRQWNPFHEYAGWALRGVLRPARSKAAWRRLARLRAGTGPVFVLPLQLEGDYQLRRHSGFPNLEAAIAEIVRSFAAHAPRDALLAVKGHPLDNGLTDWGRVTLRHAAAGGVADRVLWLPELPFGPVLAPAAGIVTVNSTAGLQAISQGKPTIALGRAIYDMPGLTFQGGLDAFWTGAAPPDLVLADALRRVLAAHCLIRGGFFSEAGIAEGVANAVARLEAARALRAAAE
ncbi:capsular biosynthesis protein [Roseomonas sp. PWR1]|uniref:Capsular biosynthesis protein n=1 Tax=Roseomonas nitratireducens TaxID=2820810 RepID=A0ABS4AZU1_9PROT|nr:capsular biosynthesis protein [Neoroseomonas nitratireducens]MBP0466866.1 capsular biosynthesis protein [Neoroseomonas nitratireducens]